jgi:hypothetical protein
MADYRLPPESRQRIFQVGFEGASNGWPQDIY